MSLMFKSKPNREADSATAYPSRADHLNDLSDRQRSALRHEYRRSKRQCATVREMKEDPSGSAIRC